jgi:HK97 family phage prohead protease
MKDRLRLAAAVRVLGAGDDRTVDVVASTGSRNVYGYVIDQAGWDLGRYRANPVVLYDHAWDAPDAARSLPIGRAEAVRVEDGALCMSLRFASAEANPLAEQVRRLFAEDMLHAVSVGFSALDMRIELRDGEEVPVFSRAELLEVSVVPIPADPHAVRAMALAAGRGSKMTMKGIALALGLRDDASEGEVMARAAALADVVRLTGANAPTEALGVVNSWRAAAERLPALEAELKSARTEADARERAGLVERLRSEKKITPAMEAWAGSVELASLRAFAAAAAPIGPLAAAPAEPERAAGAAFARWEDLPRMERHRLALVDPAKYQALYSEHMARASAAGRR